MALPSTDPSTLANNATCFECIIPPGDQMAVQTYLLALITGQDTSQNGANALANAARCFNCTTPTGDLLAVQNYLLWLLACTAPLTPTGLTLASSTTTSLTITWTEPAGGIPPSQYLIQWGTSSGVYTNSATSNTTSYTITGLNPSTTYFVVVQAVGPVGCNSSNSSELSATTAASGCVSAVVTAYVANVVANGGVAPNTATQTALCNFWNGLVADGLDTTMVYVMVFVSNQHNLLTVTTPLFSTAGNNPATNHGLSNASIGNNGIQGNGATQWLNIGVNCTTAFPSQSNCGWTAYTFDCMQDAPANDLGILNNAGSGFVGAFFDTNLNEYFSLIGSNTNTVETPQVALGGFLSGNRVSNTDHRLYFANSTNPFAQVGITDANAEGALINNANFGVLANWNSTTAAAQNFTDDVISYFAIHSGHSSAQSQKHFNRVQTLLRALGGGFI